MASKHRYRYFVDPASWFEDSKEESQAQAPRHKRNQVLSVEQLDGGCVLVRVEFQASEGRGVPCPASMKNLF